MARATTCHIISQFNCGYARGELADAKDANEEPREMEVDATQVVDSLERLQLLNGRIGEVSDSMDLLP